MKRILNAWPYALGVVGLFGVLWAYTLVSNSCYDPSAGCGGLGTFDWKGIDLMLHFLVFPVLAFLGTGLLGLRRGYDWVTLLVCLAIGMAIPDPVYNENLRLEAYWGNKDWFFLGIYAVVVHLGVAGGIVVRAIVRRTARGPVAAA